VSAHERLRTTFDEVPALYERARPGYPPQLFDDLDEWLPPGSRLLEIGCGTGQATVPLAERGHRITCVELGPNLADAARRKLAGFPAVEVVNANVETWEPAETGFDGVVAFSSFHWLAPDLRYAKPAALLRPRGILAVVSANHVLPADGDAFFLEVQQDYEAVVPDEPETRKGPPRPPEELPDRTEELAASGVFRPLAARRYLYDVVYTAQEYVDVLSTYSGHRALPDRTREELLRRIRRRIESRPGGTVRKTYLALLNVAERS
jgi:SAM-dependent methyltransferase